MPEIRWLTPIYHPNISEIGMVCLGGYGTHWVPSVQLDELCVMLWDMARYHNYDIRSPYNREAALWVANQTSILFPTDAGRSATFGRRWGEWESRRLVVPRPVVDGRSERVVPGRSSVPVCRGRHRRRSLGSASSSSAMAGSSAARRTPAATRPRPEEAAAAALPSNAELQALVTAEANSGPARADVGARRGRDPGNECFVAHEATDPRSTTASDEIVFIE